MRLLRFAMVLGLMVPTSPVAAKSSATGRLNDELRHLSAFGLPGAVLVSESGRTLVKTGCGRSPATGVRNTPSTLFDIGSLAKQFTATAIMALQADGRLSIRDTVGRFFTTAPPSFARIRIDQVLSHTAGLMRGNVTAPDDPSMFTPTSRDTALARIFRSRLLFAPGSQMAYSNAGYVLLAAIIEKASGRSYPEYLHRRLFEPAGLHETVFWGESTRAVVANGFDELGETVMPRTAPRENWTLRGAGGVLSSVDDLDRWMRALMRGRVIPLPLVDSMMTGRTGGYGYGWRVGSEGTPYAGSINHGGDVPGFGSQLIWFPASKRLIILLANRRDEDDTYPTRLVLERSVFAALGDTLGQTPNVLGPTLPSDTTLVGEYLANDGSRFQVSSGVAGMSLGARNQRAVEHLWPVARDSAAYWQTLSERTVRVIRAVLARDTAEVRRALSPGDDAPYVYEQLSESLPRLASSDSIAALRALGTYPAALPTGALWTDVELGPGDHSPHYRLRWYRDVVGSYHARAGSAAAPMALARTRDGWLAWNAVHRTPPLHLEKGADASMVLTSASERLVLHPVRPRH